MGEQNVTGADPTDWRRRHRPDTTADRISRGRRSEGEARSDKVIFHLYTIDK